MIPTLCVLGTYLYMLVGYKSSDVFLRAFEDSRPTEKLSFKERLKRRLLFPYTWAFWDRRLTTDPSFLIYRVFAEQFDPYNSQISLLIHKEQTARYRKWHTILWGFKVTYILVWLLSLCWTGFNYLSKLTNLMFNLLVRKLYAETTKQDRLEVLKTFVSKELHDKLELIKSRKAIGPTKINEATAQIARWTLLKNELQADDQMRDEIEGQIQQLTAYREAWRERMNHDQCSTETLEQHARKLALHVRFIEESQTTKSIIQEAPGDQTATIQAHIDAGMALIKACRAVYKLEDEQIVLEPTTSVTRLVKHRLRADAHESRIFQDIANL